MDWLVVGGGPVGVIALAVLLTREPDATIHWVDPNFDAMGALGKYGSVPANTRTDRLVAVFRSLAAMDFEASQARRRMANVSGIVLSDGIPSGTEPLQASIDALHDGSVAIRQLARVNAVTGVVTALRGSHASAWEGDIVLGGRGREAEPARRVVRARRVVLAPGAAPRRPPQAMLSALAAGGAQLLEFDDAVAPHRLRQLLARDPKRFAAKRFVVVGASHSGMLAARNAVTICNATSVDVYNPGPVRLAEERDGWIKLDGTGLKGDVREWAVEVLREQAASKTDDETCDEGTNGRGAIGRVTVHPDAPRTGDAAADGTELAHRILAGGGGDWLVWATGFERQQDGSVPLPRVSWSGANLDLVSAAYDGRNGLISGTERLHGIGIAFPEWYTDPEGHTEPRVGYVNSLVEHVGRLIDHDSLASKAVRQSS